MKFFTKRQWEVIRKPESNSGYASALRRKARQFLELADDEDLVAELRAFARTGKQEADDE